MGKIFVVMGKSAVGKDSLLNLMVEKGYKRVVSHCSRPRRSNEISDRDYHFVKQQQMLDMIENNEFVETRSYNVVENQTWLYGISKSEIDLESNDNYISVVDGQGFKTLREFYGAENVVGIYLWISNRERLLRSLNRCELDDKAVLEIIRRFKDDDAVFTKEVISNCVLQINNISLSDTLNIVLRNLETRI